MLLKNPKHEKYHTLGPKDCGFGSKQEAVMMVSISRQTIDNESMSINVPIFECDDREAMDARIGMAASILQERQEDANQAWLQVDADRKARAEKE